MKNKLFIVVVLAALLLLSSLSVSMAGYWETFTAYTNPWNGYVELKEGKRMDCPSSRAAIGVSADSITFFCKIEAKVNNRWVNVTRDGDVTCFSADPGSFERVTLIHYRDPQTIFNNMPLRACGRSGQYLHQELMKGSINFN